MREHNVSGELPENDWFRSPEDRIKGNFILVLPILRIWTRVPDGISGMKLQSRYPGLLSNDNLKQEQDKAAA